MNLLFFFDAERVCTDKNGNYYASGNFPMDVWNRYLSICDHLYVIMREGQKNVTDLGILSKMEKIDRSNVDIRLVKDIYGSFKDYLNLRYRRYNKKLTEDLLRKSNFVIVRGANKNVVKRAVELNRPYMVEVIGSTWDALWNHSWKGKVLALPSEIKSKRLIRKAPWVIYVTSKFLQGEYPTKGRNIGVSDVSIDENDEAILTNRLKKIEESFKDGKKSVSGVASSSAISPLTLGTAAAINVRYKGQEYVIQALSLLKKKGIIVNYELAGLGENDYLLSVARSFDVENQVRFVGPLSHDRVFRWMDSIDVYIQPSLLEGLPRSVVEAMSRGLPVLGTAVGGIPELLGKGEIFKIKEAEDIARHIERMDKIRMMNLARKNFDKAKAYNKQVLDEKRSRFYREFRDWAEKQKNSYVIK